MDPMGYYHLPKIVDIISCVPVVDNECGPSDLVPLRYKAASN